MHFFEPFFGTKGLTNTPEAAFFVVELITEDTVDIFCEFYIKLLLNPLYS